MSEPSEFDRLIATAAAEAGTGGNVVGELKGCALMLCHKRKISASEAAAEVLGMVRRRDSLKQIRAACRPE